MRRTRQLPALAIIAALSSILLVAARGPTVIEDPCDPGSFRNIADICAVVIEPAVIAGQDTSPRLDAVTFTMVVSGNTDDWVPGDMWDVMWRHGGCTWAIRWFHDPGGDLPDELTTRLDRSCDGGMALGFELAPPTLQGTTLSSEVSIEDLRRIDPGIGIGTVLKGLKAHSYFGLGWQPPAISEYAQVTRESDDTDGANVVLK